MIIDSIKNNIIDYFNCGNNICNIPIKTTAKNAKNVTDIIVDQISLNDLLLVII